VPPSIKVETVRDWIGLSLVHGLGPVHFHQLIDRFGSPTRVLNGAALALKELGGPRSGYFEELNDAGRLRQRADRELQALGKIGGRALIYDEPDYPDLLRHTGQPPPVVYLCGNSALLEMASVAMVGSRAATSYGRRVGWTIARDLAGAGMCVVSGLALGIDAAAHRGALDADGATIGVLGCGLDVVYPRGNRHLYEGLRRSGLLLSEYPLGTRPEGFRFPARNRIIAGLCGAVVVVEASKKSGSLITVQHALEQGREIFAVPGQVDSLKSAGTHWLVQQGAGLAVSAADVINQLNVGHRSPATLTASGRPGADLDQKLAAVLSLIEPYPQTRDALLQRSGLSAAEFNEVILTLELEGMVETSPGNMIHRSIEGRR
jgi:DNA processing protein